MRHFTKNFTQQEPLDEAAIAAAVEVMQSGRLHRYNTVPGDPGDVALLEREFAEYMDLPYCLACTSGGYALHIALRSVGLLPGEPVLCNAYTLSPVPGAIHNAGGRVVLVDIDDDSRIDLNDLDAAASESGARILMLSHMRGHIADMDAILKICDQHDILLIEDCAHTMGARWKGRLSGSFGQVACFSTQTYKHINSGEGGFLVTRDELTMRRAIVHSGSYMLYDKHLAAPGPDTYGAERLSTPNYSGRMDNLRAAILRPQLRSLDTNVARWLERYQAVANGLTKTPDIKTIERPAHEQFVGSSIQFRVPEFSNQQIVGLVQACAERGVPLKWFGAPEPSAYTSRYDSWHYLGEPRQLPNTARVLSTLCDMRIPLTFNVEDCSLIAELIVEAVQSVKHTASIG
ncbi:MAG: DegT/DnrJ/EryC1/StrS family aminotransferase [Burkholderiaceae bacterium]